MRDNLFAKNITLISESIKLDPTGSISVHVEVLNKAQGSYFLGVLVPIIPVFFFPQFHFQLDEAENLKIRCTVNFNPDKKYLIKDPNRDWYFLSSEGVKFIEERHKNGFDTCASARVVLSDGKELKQISKRIENGNTIFEFEFPAVKIKAFTLEVLEVQLYDGKKTSVDNKFNLIFEDFTRYYILPVAP